MFKDAQRPAAVNFSDPQNNIKQFKLGEGMHVADLGSGAGFYVLAAAEVVGEEGRVYAVDVQRELLRKVKREADARHLGNIVIIWGDLEKERGSTLGDASMDAVILTNILFQVENKDKLVGEAMRVLKSKGKMLVVDWTDSFGGLGPRDEDVVPETQARGLVEEAGFVVEETISAGKHHYGMIVRKPGKKK